MGRSELRVLTSAIKAAGEVKDIRQICELRKQIHHDVAGMLGLDYAPILFGGPADCPDFCGICDREQLRLEQQIIDRGLPEVDWLAMLSLRLPPETATAAPHPNHTYQAEAEPLLAAEPEPPAYNSPQKAEEAPASSYKFYGQFAVAGSQFSDANRIVFEICLDDELIFLREPDNAYDSNAIRVMFPYNGRTHFLGYIPQSKSRELAALIDSGLGHLLAARVCYVQNDEGYGPIIRFNLFIRQNG